MADEKAVLTGKIVAAYLRGNSLAVGELPELIQATHAALCRLQSPQPLATEAQSPAVALKKSVTAEAIFCLDCGKAQKMLKRHLQTAHGLSVDDYRSKWNLASDYPMVAPNYAQQRSQLALQIGLGRKKGSEAPQAEEASGKSAHQYPTSRWSRPAD